MLLGPGHDHKQQSQMTLLHFQDETGPDRACQGCEFGNTTELKSLACLCKCMQNMKTLEFCSIGTAAAFKVEV